MIHMVQAFFFGEDGAVTVDWVILTAAIVGLAIAAYVNIENGSNSMASAVGTYLTDTPLEDLHGGPN